MDSNALPSDNSSGADRNIQPPRRMEQPTAAYLQNIGIKVIDFAYHSTLPPVPTYRIQPRQVQPGIPRPLQRQSTEPDDGSQSTSQGTQHLERKITEPALVPEPGAPVRMPAYSNLRDAQESRSTTASARLVHTLIDMITANQPLHPPTSSNPVPSSQLHSPAIEIQENVTSSRHDSGSSIFFSSSPLTPLPSSPACTQMLSSLSNRTNSTFDLRSPVIPRPLQPRYALRKRPTATNNASSKPVKRARRSGPSESPQKSRAPYSKKKTRDDSSLSSRAASKRALHTEDKGKRKHA